MSEEGKTGESKAHEGFGGRRVVSFESRRAAEMASLIQRHGGVPVSAPALREVVLSENAEALAFARALRDGACDALVLMTGAGTRALVDEMAPEMDRPTFVDLLGQVRVIARGPKPAVALREMGARGFIVVPEPNTWREVQSALKAALPLAGCRVAVQEHGAPSEELYAALRDEGAIVTPVRVYKWALPEDTGPLREALGAIAAGEIPIALFTSRSQVEHALAVAEDEGIGAQVRERLRRGVVASIGPVCTEALRAEGLSPDIEPEHPKMGHLVKTAASRAAAILEAKQ